MFKGKSSNYSLEHVAELRDKLRENTHFLVDT